MSIKNVLVSILNEAKVYKNHGLLDESRSKCNQALEIIQANQQLSNRKALIQLIESKIAAIPQDPLSNQSSEIEQPRFESGRQASGKVPRKFYGHNFGHNRRFSKKEGVSRCQLTP